MNRLKKVRKAIGLTHEAVARAVGVARSTYTHIERGRGKPSFELAQRLAAFFGHPVDWLFPNPHDPSAKDGEPQ